MGYHVAVSRSEPHVMLEMDDMLKLLVMVLYSSDYSTSAPYLSSLTTSTCRCLRPSMVASILLDSQLILLLFATNVHFTVIHSTAGTGLFDRTGCLAATTFEMSN
jgi:hypothetical protein